MAFGQLSLKGRALKLLAAREHSRQELERKLAQHETEPGQVKAALDELQARGFIDEQRVVDSLLHRRASRLGAARIRQELQAKGIAADRVADAVAALRGTEVARAREVWRRKFDAPPADAQQRAKQARFLIGRGFSAEAVRRVLAWDEADEGGG
ncbi:recombination regulator RecX [Ramlibacter sp. USB13]|uniref:Regulatory protein RecX n=1 Tax=Ramlibacter cellulosilyticus TaxID=2764187 RepID=A0A923MQL5_9BURK|nr:recombination regulator RecX [Ramlibacter cellulosilyticus]MBC5782774.1 recombination regulator RecX [Ramlibacter cellulosilyticus]